MGEGVITVVDDGEDVDATKVKYTNGSYSHRIHVLLTSVYISSLANYSYIKWLGGNVVILLLQGFPIFDVNLHEMISMCCVIRYDYVFSDTHAAGSYVYYVTIGYIFCY